MLSGKLPLSMECGCEKTELITCSKITKQSRSLIHWGYLIDDLLAFTLVTECLFLLIYWEKPFKNAISADFAIHLIVSQSASFCRTATCWKLQITP